MRFQHSPVLLQECIDGLQVSRGGIFFDGTLGGGGHTEEILKQNAKAQVIGVDRDGDAIQSTSARLSEYRDRLKIVHDNFKNVKQILRELSIDRIDGALIDLGVSSYQLDTFERGFSYRSESSRLDMRMNREDKLTAYDVINGYTPERLMKILYEYGEEKYTKSIVRNIIKAREQGPIETCGELTEIILKSTPQYSEKGGHPAKRVFQAVRIEVNGELDGLDRTVFDLADVLKSGGRMCFITFHSLEDRIVKQAMKYLESDCVCDKSAPICTCGKVRQVRILTKKPILPTAQEAEENARSKSAKLRIAEKI